MNWIELVAVVFGLLAVWLVVRQSIWCWPAGLVQVTLYVVIFLDVKLYSDVLLHLIYIGLQLYGWYHWLYGGADRTPLAVSRLSPAQFSTWIAVALAGTAGWGYLMATTTDAAIPYGDAFTTAASLIAFWLQAGKKLQSWLFWIAVDIIGIGIYYYKGLTLTAGLYAVFLVLSVYGYLSWRRAGVDVTA